MSEIIFIVQCILFIILFIVCLLFNIYNILYPEKIKMLENLLFDIGDDNE